MAAATDGGAAGIDGTTTEHVKAGAAEFLNALQAQLKDRSYRMPATYLDLNFTCQVTQRLAFFGLVRNVFNAPPSLLYVYGSQTPGYARTKQFQDTGVYLNAGLKGSF